MDGAHPGRRGPDHDEVVAGAAGPPRPAGAVRLSVRVWGSGPRTALLVHGFSDDAQTWWRVGPALADLGHTVLAPDLRGHGCSPRAAALRARGVRAGPRRHAAVRRGPRRLATASARWRLPWPPPRWGRAARSSSTRRGGGSVPRRRAGSAARVSGRRRPAPRRRALGPGRRRRRAGLQRLRRPRGRAGCWRPPGGPGRLRGAATRRRPARSSSCPGSSRCCCPPRIDRVAALGYALRTQPGGAPRAAPRRRRRLPGRCCAARSSPTMRLA